MIRSTILVLFGFLMTAAAQQPKASTAATARIDGVTLDGAERSVAGVNVTALQDDATRNTVTDAQGRFTFPVRHGTVRFLTRKEGYVESRDGILITVTPGQQLRGVTLRMVAAASISGSVYDARRKPVQYAHATLMRYTYDENGARVLRPAGNSSGGMTNERGEFRISGAEPGEYLLQIEPPMFAEREPGEPFVTGYYPDTPYVSPAQLITLKSDSETRLDDLTLPSARGGTIRIRLVNQIGERVDNTMSKYVRWRSSGGDALSAVIPLLYMGGAERAEIPVSPGTYDVTAGWLRGSTGNLPPIGLGQKRVDVGRGTVDVEISVTKGVSVVGRVVREQAKGGQKPVSGVRCEIENDQWPAANAISATDGSISMDSVQPAAYRVACYALPPDTYLSKISQTDRDVLKSGLEVQPDSQTNFTVLLAGDGGTVGGIVTDAKGQKSADVVVALVPDPPLRDAKHLFRSVRTDQIGGFTIGAVAPGDYRLFAWPSIDGAAYKNEEFMKRYEDGTPVKVTSGAKLSTSVKLLDK